MTDIRMLERARFFPDDFPIAIQRVVNTRDLWNVGRRYRREFWKITYLVDGRGDLLLDERRHPLRPGMVMLIHPRSATTYDIAGDGLDLYNLMFDPACIAREIPEIHDSFRFFSVFADDFDPGDRVRLYLFDATPAVTGLIRGMAREYAEKRSNHRVLLKLRLLELLVLLLREGEKRATSHTPEQVVRYIANVLNRRFRTRVRLDELAEQTGLGRFRLCRLFKERTGKTIITTLNDIRLEHAAELLRTRPDLTVSEIGYDAGYNDPAHFYRLFERRFATRPRAYRERHASVREADGARDAAGS